MQPGLHFKWPWIETVYKIDMQTHTKTYDKMEAYSADQQPANLRVSVTMHVAPDKVAEMYSRFGGDSEAAVQRLIAPHVFEKVKVVFGRYSGRANSVRAEAQAQADAIRLKGEAEAQAIAARGKALQDNPKLVDLVQAERWDGKLPVTMIPGGSAPMLAIGQAR